MNHKSQLTLTCNFSVWDNRYQILPTAKDIRISDNEYINILSLDHVTEADNGTYICFVAKNGLNSLTFKSATVFVLPGRPPININPTDGEKTKQLEAVASNEGQISLSMMLVIIGLSVASISMLIVLATWYIRYKVTSLHKIRQNTSNTGTTLVKTYLFTKIMNLKLYRYE